MSNMNRTMQETMRLMQSGDLHAATQAIQRGLCGNGEPSAFATAESNVAAATRDCIDGEYRALPDGPDAGQSPETVELPERDSGDASQGTFSDHRFKCEAGAMHYKLFVPAGLGTNAPLIVMLHGCTQSPDDFARGTRMNALAREHGYVVAYPAQAQSKNASKCWNWFRSSDQQRGRGEPAILAALTRHLVMTHRLDARRVYVAGLSAGGAMAAVLAATYPDIYSAIAIHSGLPFGAAHDLPSAFAAMKQGAGISDTGAPSTGAEPVPVIVFHGDGDTTVHPCNGAAVVAQSMRSTASAIDVARTSVERGTAPGGRTYTRTIFSNANGSIVAEQWVVHGAGHAWFGGDPSGSYTDPSGPDASELMLRFFSQHARRVTN